MRRLSMNEAYNEFYFHILKTIKIHLIYKTNIDEKIFFDSITKVSAFFNVDRSMLIIMYANKWWNKS